MNSPTFRIGLAILATAIGWGGDGHRLITALTDEILTKGTARFLRNAVGEDIESASIWADSGDAETRYPKSNFYHFSSTPYRNCAVFDMNRDCGFGKSKGLCIVTGLVDAIERAIDINVSDTVRSDALKFIVHLMADIHQPLHTGFREDTGGLRIMLGSPENRDLHYIWDNWLIDEIRDGRAVGKNFLKKLRDRLATNHRAFETEISAKVNMTDILSSRGKILKYVSQLASETSTTVTCKFGYTDIDGSWISPNATIGASFVESREPIVIVQLLKAAVRLGLLLEGISEKFYKARDMRRSEMRADRLERLFTTPSISTLPVVVDSGSRFEVLWLMDPLDASPAPSIPPPITQSRKLGAASSSGDKRSRAKSKKITDAELLDSILDDVVSERNSYTFMGVDLSLVVLTTVRGMFLITTSDRVAQLRRPKSDFPAFNTVGIYFGGNGEVTYRQFVTDNKIFGRRVNDNEFLIRVILKISNVDPRIDLTDYMATIRPVRRTHASLTPIVKRLLTLEYLQSIDTEAATVPTCDRLVEIRRKIVLKRGPNGSLLFIHTDSLVRDATVANANRKFYLFQMPGIDRRRKTTSNVFVDSRIATDIQAHSTREIMLLSQIAQENWHMVAGLETNPFWVELDEMVNLVDTRERGEPDPKDLVFVHFLYNIPANQENSLRVIQWFARGQVEHEDQLAEFLGVGTHPYEKQLEEGR